MDLAPLECVVGSTIFEGGLVRFGLEEEKGQILSCHQSQDPRSPAQLAKKKTKEERTKKKEERAR